MKERGDVKNWVIKTRSQCAETMKSGLFSITAFCAVSAVVGSRLLSNSLERRVYLMTYNELST